ncbi:hypothetical protein BGZ76_008285 [Entomortierella beljakovae]|nr:hypothetical protein BGZ76_008285 [Entomortierella beljakovae]
MDYPIDELTNYFSTLQPFSTPVPPFVPLPRATPTATSWASLPVNLSDAEQSVGEFLSQIQNNQRNNGKQEAESSSYSPNKSATTLDNEKSWEDTISVSSISESVLDPLLDPKNAMYMTSVLRKRKIKMRKHKYKKLRKRTRALRKKLGK